MNVVESIRGDVVNDVNWNRAAHLTVKATRALPSASVKYASDKLPIIGWLPRYNYRWLVSDVIAGITVGLMLIPQGLSYAKIATIPVQYGLMSSWLPSAIYAFMGTSKGPYLISFLTNQWLEIMIAHNSQTCPLGRPPSLGFSRQKLSLIFGTASSRLLKSLRQWQ